MKLLYLQFVDCKQIGILKKIRFQVQSLKRLNFEVDLLESKQNKKYLNEKIINIEKNTIFRHLNKVKLYLKLAKFEEIKNYDVIYLRYILSNPMSIYLLRLLKKNKKIKIFLEIPTYPYDKEIKNRKIAQFLDKYYRKKLYKYVDKIVTYSEDKEIWGIPCINISNGINLEEIKLINKEEKKNEKITFTSVSNCSFWHGIDRFLKSLEKYGEQENKKEIIFNIVGEGAESHSLKELVSKSVYLSKVVKFQGFKTGKELNDIYYETDIGVGSLGRHRSGLYTMKALKNREYCAKGIPMIFSEDDPDLRDVSFVYHATPDEELIDIEKLINWYEDINLESKEIRKYAEKFSWDIQMKKVIDEIEKI